MRLRDLALLLVLSALWGTAFMAISLGLRSFSPLLFAAIRFDVAAVFLLALAALRGGAFVPETGRDLAAVVIAALFNVAGYHAFLFWGQQFTTAAVASVVVGLNPVLTTAFSRLALPGERVRAAGFLGLGLGFAGIVLLATLKPGNLLDARGVGELAVLAAIASFAFGSVLGRRSPPGMGVLAFVAWSFLGGAVLLHAAALALEPAPRASFDAVPAATLLYLALVASGLGFLIYFTLIERVGPIRVNLVSYLTPLFATASAMLVLGDPFELRAFVAFALIAAGFALVTR